MKAKLLLILCSIAAFSACTRQIPNQITAAEYTLYSQWVKAHFEKTPPERLYFLSRTGIFDPLDAACKSALEKDGASYSLMNELHAVGTAEYRLDFYSGTNLQIPWSYKEVDQTPELPSGSFHTIALSRIAFNPDQTEALFGFFDTCAAGECGHGGYIEAKKKHEDGNWIFRQVGCVIVS